MTDSRGWDAVLDAVDEKCKADDVKRGKVARAAGGGRGPT
jgi:hypothetical protein